MGMSCVIARQYMRSHLFHFKGELLTSDWRGVATDTQPGRIFVVATQEDQERRGLKELQGAHKHWRCSLTFILAGILLWW